MNISNKKLILSVVALASFIVPMMGATIIVALPSMANDLKIDNVLLNWIPTSYLLALAVFMLPFGALADTYGRRNIFGKGVLIFAIASFICSILPSAPLLIIFRVVQGIGASMIFSTGIAILTSIFNPSERGKVIGASLAATYSGISLGPFIGGILTQHFGWRSIFLVNIPFCLFIAYVIYAKFESEQTEQKKNKFDYTGFVFYSLFLISMMYGLSILTSGYKGLALLSLSAVFFTLLIIIEKNIPNNPLININLFRTNLTFTYSNLAALINYAATFAISFLMSLYLQYIKGFEPQRVGYILVIQPIFMTILSPYAGKLSDRTEPRIVASIGMGMIAVGISIFSFLSPDTSTNLIKVTLVLLGCGFALFSSPNTNAIMSSVDKKFYGSASAMVGTMRSIGQMLSMGIANAVSVIIVGRVQITPEHFPAFLKSVNISFLIFDVLCIAGVYFSLVRGKIR